MSDPHLPVRVLHVDDDPAFGDLTATLLEQANETFSVVVESSASEGLTRLADGDIDVVVSDYGMPEMDGLEFLAAVRDAYPSLPFILFTGQGSEDVASEAIKTGVTDYVRKAAGSDQYTLLANRIENAAGRHAAEQDLYEAQRTYQQMTRLASDSFWMWDRRTNDLTLSDGFEQVFGLDAIPVEDRIEWARDHIHPADRAGVRDAVEALLETDTAEVELECRFRRGDGSYADVRSRTTVIETATGDVDRLVGVMTDVSERTRHEQDLEQYRTILETLPDAVWMLDQHGTIQFANTITRERANEASLVGENFRTILEEVGAHKTTIDEFASSVESVVRGDTDLVHTEVTLPDGEETAVRDVLSVPVAMGNETWAIGISRDMTKQRRAEDRFRALFANLADPIVGITYGTANEPIISMANTAFERVFGYDLTDVHGESLNDLIVPEEQAPESEEIDQLTAAGKSVNREIIRRTSDGSLRHFQFQVVHTETSADQQVFYGVYRDITETKRYAERLEAQNDRLDAFAGKVTHDLRNPLTLAQGWLDVVRDTPSEAAIDKIDDALARMETIVDDVLSLARHGNNVVETTSVSLYSAIDVAWRMAGRESATLDWAADLGEVEANETRLVALFENLFRNAIEHCGPDVTVHVGRLADGGIFVEDDGPGIPAADCEYVFDAGYTTTQTGTGFGLAIVQEIADAHGWAVSIESTHDGTRFEFRSKPR